jgi:ribonucleoside-triphosphate reductase
MVIKQVIKRNGSVVDFSKDKIENAIKGAFKDINVEYDDNIYKSVMWYLRDLNKEVVNIEEIQDVIEKSLMKKHPEVAKAYIVYRYQHKTIREFVESKERFINQYKSASNTANATIDDNSNMSSKNVGILNNEIHKEDNIQISRGMIMRKLRDLYPDFDSKQYIRDLNHHIIYKHDESTFAGAVAPYCVSVSMYPFLINGIKGLGGLSAAPKNLDSYCGMYINMIFAISSQFAGAVATSEFLLYFDYFARKEWGDEYYKYFDKKYKSTAQGPRTIQQQIHQYFQQVVYSINQPAAARGMQSAFVNFSYFDKNFFNGMFGDFYFPDGTKPIWESLFWLQKEFMTWFNNERLRCVLTFPVESYALVYQDGEFLDKESADFVAQEYENGHSFFTYISDTVDSLSSCCFEGDEIIEVYDKDLNKKQISIRDFVGSFNTEVNDNGIEINTGYKIQSYDNKGSETGMVDITGLLKKENLNLIEFNVDGKIIKVTPDHIMLVRNIETGEVVEMSAEYVYKNINKLEIAIDE